jgi:hypothetical protein
MVMQHYTSEKEICALIIKPDKFRCVSEINVLFDSGVLTTSLVKRDSHMEHLLITVIT